MQNDADILLKQQHSINTS